MEDGMLRRSILALLLVLFGNSAAAEVPPTRDATRAELLYSTHCIACHSAQVHWRDKKLVTDWASLQSEVRRWQEVSGLGWSKEDIAEVARYLNALYYRYPAPV
jgi:mono/diheme cytochrome c family protein